MDKICKHVIFSDYTVSKWELPLVFLSILFGINTYTQLYFSVIVKRSFEKVLAYIRYFSDTVKTLTNLNLHTLHTLLKTNCLRIFSLFLIICLGFLGYMGSVVNITFMIFFFSYIIKPKSGNWASKIRKRCQYVLSSSSFIIIIAIIILLFYLLWSKGLWRVVSTLNWISTKEKNDMENRCII
jgi:hypothetical protein